MLRLIKITKDYKLADTVVRALRGVSISFRANEFVSILGPSGCGKTTLLNLVGGLDKYTSGDMFIAGRSTKEFKDSDWDVYRNHRVGFIFQSYNLIPHQTVLGNVELALTIAGINKTEREARAKAALDKVGLSDQYYKKPNQLSGGQCQRVAIARALVNDPEVLLADEPTGALDTKTSVQIMDLIKEIAKDRLVIMVTHNPELAEQYSTRIIKLLDGELIDDTNPFSESEEIQECERIRTQKLEEEKTLDGNTKVKKEKAKMSFITAFRLSLQNLFTKKARTIMTSVAGSIGIIGISLVLSISYGVQSFINNMQNDMLSGNPITVSKSGFDINSLMTASSQSEQRERLEVIDGQVNIDSMIAELVERSETLENIMISNTITDEYVDYVKALPRTDAAAIRLDYGLDLKHSLYTDFVDESGNSKNMSVTAVRAVYTSILEQTEFKNNAAMISSLSDPFRQAFEDEEYILGQYSFMTENSRFPKEKDEIMLVLGRSGQLADLTLAELGYLTQNEFLNMVYKATETEETENPKYDPDLDVLRVSYDKLMEKEFTWYPNDTIFKRSTTLSIPGMGDITTAEYIPYKEDLPDTTDSVNLKVVGILQLKEGISYGCLSNGFYYTEALANYAIEKNKDSLLFEDMIKEDSESIASAIKGTMPLGGLYFNYNYTYDGVTGSSTGLVGNADAMSQMMALISGTSSQLAYDDMRSLSLQQLGGLDIPNMISIYPVNFETKDAVLAYLDKWNSDEDVVVFKGMANEKILTKDDREKITYSDPISIIIAMISTFINVITTALIGFTSLSLVVSSVMIGIITYVSVVERVKEIGIIRSLGGRKRDVSYLFNAETFIIGLVSGIIGIGFTYFASFIINVIVRHFSADITAIAIFPIGYAITMISVSVILTLISGLLPSRSAAKKDPVVALRSE